MTRTPPTTLLACGALLFGACVPRAYERLELADVADRGGAARVFSSPCLEVGVRLAKDTALAATTPVVQYELGNRCDRSTPVDLRAMTVTAVCGDGRRWALTPHDPRGELRALRLEARFDVFEAIAYARPPDDSACVIREVCVTPTEVGESPLRPEGACLPFVESWRMVPARRGFR